MYHDTRCCLQYPDLAVQQSQACKTTSCTATCTQVPPSFSENISAEAEGDCNPVVWVTRRRTRATPFWPRNPKACKPDTWRCLSQTVQGSKASQARQSSTTRARSEVPGFICRHLAFDCTVFIPGFPLTLLWSWCLHCRALADLAQRARAACCVSWACAAFFLRLGPVLSLRR